MKNKIKGLISSAALLIGTQSAFSQVTWNGNVDDNWNMPANWSTGEVPGTTPGSSVYLNGTNSPVVATVVETDNSCSLQLDQDSALEINEGTLKFDDLTLSGGTIMHLAGDVEVNGSLNMISNGSMYRAAGGSLAVTGETRVARGALVIERDTHTLSTGDLTVARNGTLRFDFDLKEVNTIQVSNHFSITAGAKLEIDLRDYTMGSNEIELVSFSSVSGSFSPADISIIGLGGGTVTMDEDSLNLTIVDDVAPRSSTLWFVATPGEGGEALDLQVNTGRRIRNLTSPDMSYTATTQGNDRIYSGSWSGSDFDGDGSNDTVTFDLRVKGFEGSTFSYDSTTGAASMTALGDASSVNGNSDGWSVGTDNLDLDAGETLQFTIENLSVSTSGGVVEGFMGTLLAEPSGGNSHVLIIGQGEGLEATQSNFATSIGFNLEDPLLITSGADSRVNVGQVVFKIQVSELPDFMSTEVDDYSHYPTGPQHRKSYAPVTNLNYPEWTWDTLPMSASPARNDAIPDDIAQKIATTYQMVSLGGRNYYGEDNVEAGMSAAAAAIKAHNPNVFTVTYKNSGLHHDRTAANEFFDDDEWTIYDLDENGDREYSMIRLWRRYNHNHPQCREWWSDWCVARLEDPNIDGIFIDKGEGGQDKLLNENGELETISNRVKSYVSIFERLPAGDMLTGNTIRPERVGGSRELLHMFNGAYSEGWHNGFSNELVAMSDADARSYALQLFREAQLKGVIMDPNYHQLRNLPITGDEARVLIANGQIEDVVDAIRELVQLPLAYHLIPLAENTGYFHFQINSGGDFVGDEELLWNTKPYVDEFKNPLGAPLGPPERNGYIFTRSFEHVDVWLNVETEEVRLTWDWMPVANEQSIEVGANGSLAVTLTGSNPNGSGMTFAVRDQPENGTLSGTAPNLIYTPNPGFLGTDSFTFKTYNDMSSSLKSTVSITVVNNSAPEFTSQPSAISVEAGSGINGTLAGSASDSDGNELSYSIVSGPNWLSLDANGTLSGTPSANDTGVNTWTIQVSDGLGGTATTTLTVTVQAPVVDTEFVPDPNKTYYIDSPAHNLRLAASGEDEDPYTTTTTTTGSAVEWVFVAKGNGSWHIQLAEGGTKPRLRSRNNGQTDMQPTSSSGTWTYYDFSPGALDDTYFATLPNHNASHNRLQIDQDGNVNFVAETSNGTWESLRFTEVDDGFVSLRKGNATNYAFQASGEPENGQNLQLSILDASDAFQKWEEIDRGGGFYSYQLAGTNFSLDGGKSGANGQNVYLWTTGANNYNQHWRKVLISGNTYRLEKRNASSYSIDGGNGAADEQNVYLWTSSDTNQNQHWIIE